MRDQVEALIRVLDGVETSRRAAWAKYYELKEWVEREFEREDARQPDAIAPERHPWCANDDNTYPTGTFHIVELLEREKTLAWHPQQTLNIRLAAHRAGMSDVTDDAIWAALRFFESEYSDRIRERFAHAEVVAAYTVGLAGIV